MSTERSWGAIGLGSNEMAGALFLILYRSDNNENNVTFSPRLAYGNYEPKYYPDLKFQTFNGTGVKGGYMTFNAVCNEHCRSWPAGGTGKGYIDVSSPNQQAIYALGPKERFTGDDPNAGLKMHSEHGTFTIDMKRTQGQADLPVLTKDSVSEGTTLNSRSTGNYDWKAAAHASFMVFSFMFLIPLGSILVRMEKWAKFHKFNQTFALCLVLTGLAFGILASFNYRRVSFLFFFFLSGSYLITCIANVGTSLLFLVSWISFSASDPWFYHHLSYAGPGRAWRSSSSQMAKDAAGH